MTWEKDNTGTENLENKERVDSLRKDGIQRQCPFDLSGQFDILEQFLVPSTVDREVVVLTDAEMCSAVMASRTNTAVLSAEATEILFKSLLSNIVESGPAALKIRDIIGDDPQRIGTACAWLSDTADENILELSTTPPTRKVLAVKKLKAGDFIPVKDFTPRFGDERGAPVEFGGTLTKVQVNDTTVLWFKADVTLKNISGIGFESSVSGKGPFMTTVLPKPAPAALGANCNVCGACGACGACGGCALCGGINFDAIILALVAVDSALAVTSAARPLSVLRGPSPTSVKDE